MHESNGLHFQKGVLLAPVLIETLEGQKICFPKNACITIVCDERDFSDVSITDMEQAQEIVNIDFEEEEGDFLYEDEELEEFLDNYDDGYVEPDDDNEGEGWKK